jgi:DNA-binding beta-propeller fold protein YncE
MHWIILYPFGLTTDTNGNLYVADTFNQAIRKINKITNIITIIAGTGELGYNGDNIQATSAMLFYPREVHVDLNENFI